MSDLTFIFEDTAASAGRPRKRLAQERAQPRLTPTLYKASIKTIADTSQIKGLPSTPAIDDAILHRIRKCLERANHKNTSEAEAKAAFYLASRLMGQHNVSQAEVLAHEPQSSQQKYAGQSVVSIKRADGSTNRVNNQSFVSDLASAMTNFFDCKTYSSQIFTSMEWTFYGIAENTAAAAIAFEMAYNLTSEWARPYKGNSSKSSYCLGVAQELGHMAREEKCAQESQAREAEKETISKRVEQEEAQRQAKVDRLAFSPNANPQEETDEDDDSGPLIIDDSIVGRIKTEKYDGEIDNDDAEADFSESAIPIDPEADIDVEIKRLIKTEPRETSSIAFTSSPTSPKLLDNNIKVLPNQNAVSSPSSTIKQEEIEEQVHKPTWESSMQLTTFRANARKIAEDYLKDQGVKLSQSKSRYSSISDHSAYAQGIRDGKKIDVRRNRIEA